MDNFCLTLVKKGVPKTTLTEQLSHSKKLLHNNNKDTDLNNTQSFM
jgi:hypothetical protein